MVRGVIQSTVYRYLETAILNGLPITFTRMQITDDKINYVEELIRKPPINSSKYYNVVA